MPRPPFHTLALIAGLAWSGEAAAQQEIRELREPQNLTGIPLLDGVRRAQVEFESFRRLNLPEYDGGGAPNGNYEAVVGRFQYWYVEAELPNEPAGITEQRRRLLDTLARAASEYPADDWTAGQRVRYHIEADDPRGAVAAALACRGEPWWCAALAGTAYHEARDYARADSAFTRALAQMPERQRCDWQDVGILLDEYTGRIYRRTECGSAERLRFEQRLWFLSKPLYGAPGVDTRSEYLSRVTMTNILTQAPTVHQFGFDLDERELTLRYGWSRAWWRQPGRDGGIIGQERTPAYQYLPPARAVNNPALSDSADWENGMPPIHARYSAAHALRIHPLIHQSALFRRGDSAIVVVAWDATSQPIRTGGTREMAITLARSDTLKPVTTRVPNAPLRGVTTAKGPWGQLLFSAELTAADYDSASRARYGLRPPYAIGARITLSEMLFFAPYDGLPATLEEAIPHAVPTMRVANNSQLGVYFEAYGTNPAGEMLNVTVTIGNEAEEPGFIRRRLRAIGLSREAEPVSVSHQVMSARGDRTTPLSVYLDVSSLPRGAYIVQIEVDVAGQYSVRSERTLEISN